MKEGGGKLTSVEEQALEALEKDLKAVKKAREALGDKAPTFSRGHGSSHGSRGDGVLGKRSRDAYDASSSDSDVPEDVRRIPMPRDTPPPIPKEVLDEWYAKRRARRAANANATTNANEEPLGDGKERDVGQRQKSAPATVEAKTVYEAKPVVRDLKKEAVAAFMPTAVMMKVEKGKGKAGLLEPEEADQLEREGYLKTQGPQGATNKPPAGDGELGVNLQRPEVPLRMAMVEDAEEEEEEG